MENIEEKIRPVAKCIVEISHRFNRQINSTVDYFNLLTDKICSMDKKYLLRSNSSIHDNQILKLKTDIRTDLNDLKNLLIGMNISYYYEQSFKLKITRIIRKLNINTNMKVLNK